MGLICKERGHSFHGRTFSSGKCQHNVYTVAIEMHGCACQVCRIAGMYFAGMLLMLALRNVQQPVMGMTACTGPGP